jgi:Peptidase A4 family
MLLTMKQRTLMGGIGALGVLICSAPGASDALAAPASPATAAQPSVSANWAGYVATHPADAGSHFSSVSGSWRQPGATCSSGRETDSAVWVGLGGYSEGARGLEQVGTDADCTGRGRPAYSSWFELLPAEPVNLKLAVNPGDAMVASVTVNEGDVTMRIRDLTTGGHFSTTRRARYIDASSAEWIVEAPSACVNSQTCEVLQLTDFGQVAFTGATAVAGAHTGAVADPDWSATALELQQRSFTGAHAQAGARVVPTRTLTVAKPSTSSDASGAFSVAWERQSVQLERSGPTTLPGYTGGPP